MAIINVKDLLKPYGQGSATVTALNNVSISMDQGNSWP